MTYIIYFLFFAVLMQTTPTPDSWRIDPLFYSPNDSLDPHWSPDGEKIAFVGHHEGNPEIYLLDLATQTTRNISWHPLDDYAPMWSPSGRYIAFIHREFPYVKTPVQPRIYDTETDTLEEYVLDGYDEVRILGWRDDTLIFTEGPHVRAFDAATGEGRLVYEHPEGLQPVPRITLSPNAEWVLVQMIETDRTINQRVEVATGEMETLPPEITYLHTWSPDGRQIAFVDDSNRLSSVENVATLSVYHTETQRISQLAEISGGGIFNVTWADDGRLVWTTSTHENIDQPPYVVYDNHLYLYDGSSTREVLHINHFIEGLKWSPTRDQIAFQTYAGLYVADVSTGVYHEFVQGIGKLQALEWSTDGKYVAAHVWGLPERYYMVTAVANIETGELFVYDNMDVPASPPRWSPIEPRLMFASGQRGRIGLLTLMPREL